MRLEIGNGKRVKHLHWIFDTGQKVRVGKFDKTKYPHFYFLPDKDAVLNSDDLRLLAKKLDVLNDGE